MGRLYIEPSYRSKIQLDTESDDTSRVQNYLEKVAMLIPSEIIAAYLVMMGLVSGLDSDIYGWLKWAILGLCLILTPIYLNHQSEKGKPKIVHMIVSSFALLVWAFVTTGHILLEECWEPALGSIVLVAFTLISGVIPLDR